MRLSLICVLSSCQWVLCFIVPRCLCLRQCQSGMLSISHHFICHKKTDLAKIQIWFDDRHYMQDFQMWYLMLKIRQRRWQTNRCWYMPMKLGACWKWFGTGRIDGLGMFSGMTTYSVTLLKENVGQGYSG